MRAKRNNIFFMLITVLVFISEMYYQNIFFLNEGKSYASFEGVQLIYASQDELVANYIHQSDGKKRIY